MKSGSKASKKPQERRKVPRRPVLETFSCYAVVPAIGDHRLKIHDLSEQGIGFDIDVGDVESAPRFEVSKNGRLEIQFYLNQTLCIPLTIQISRIETVNGVRKIGAKLVETGNAEYRAFATFVQLLDRILDTLITIPGTTQEKFTD